MRVREGSGPSSRCRRDEDGYYWITGRVDDVINVSGHRMGTAEVENALVAHAMVAEAAVGGAPARRRCLCTKTETGSRRPFKGNRLKTEKS